MTSFAIFGAGSIGCYVGGKLAAAGSDVTLIGRDHLMRVITTKGLKLTDHEGSEDNVEVGQLKLETNPESLRDADVIFVCVKSHATEEAAKVILQHAKAAAVVVSLQNGVANAKILRETLPSQKVFGGMVPYNVVNLGEGCFHRGTPGALILETGQETRDIVTSMINARLDANLTDNIQGVLWGKVLINLNNALNMLSDKPLKKQLLDIHYRRVWSLCIREGLNVLKAADIQPVKSGPLDPVLFAKILGLPNVILLRVAKGFSEVDEKARSSMWEDLQAGRQPEIDYINGAIVDLGKQVNVQTSVNESIIAQVNQAFEKGISPALNGKELRHLVT